MKHFLIILTVALLSVFGCTSGTSTSPSQSTLVPMSPNAYEVRLIEYNGHEYLRFHFHGYNSGTAGVVHSPDCPCHQNSKEVMYE